MIRIATTALVLTLATGSVALADPPHFDRGYDRDRHEWRDHRAYDGPHGYYGPPRYVAVPRYYYVPDYRRYGYRVYAPPPGCRWVRRDGDLLLTALATGVVLDVIYDASY